MLDDSNILKQRDNGGALEVAAKLYQQANFDCQLRDAEHDGREPVSYTHLTLPTIA